MREREIIIRLLREWQRKSRSTWESLFGARSILSESLGRFKSLGVRIKEEGLRAKLSEGFGRLECRDLGEKGILFRMEV